MKILSKELRTVDAIEYTLERKQIKNINLRIKNDGSVYVSAAPVVPLSVIEKFVAEKKEYIINATDTFNNQRTEVYEMQYASGENVTLLGKNLRIMIMKDSKEYVESDGIYVFIHVKRPDYYNRKKNLFIQWMNKQCCEVFDEIMREVYKKFIPYGIEFPQLKLRNMTSRWGSCHTQKRIITLNKRLIEAPKCCIEYVIFHEFCHFIHPNHSKDFYTLLNVMMPEWKDNKKLLETRICISK